jgi:transcriptional regulator with XRE-family HTH domain
MARALGLTRAYISMLNKTRVSITATVITRLAAQLGNIEDNWWIHFEIVPWGVSDPNHPVYNQEKHSGRIPYAQFSSNAQERKQDYKVEQVEWPWDDFKAFFGIKQVFKNK